MKINVREPRQVQGRLEGDPRAITIQIFNKETTPSEGDSDSWPPKPCRYQFQSESRLGLQRDSTLIQGFVLGMFAEGDDGFVRLLVKIRPPPSQNPPLTPLGHTHTSPGGTPEVPRGGPRGLPWGLPRGLPKGGSRGDCREIDKKSRQMSIQRSKIRN